MADEVAGAASGLFADPAQPLEARVADLLARLTLEEKVALMAGASSFTCEGVARLGVPRIRMTDGPTGVRSNEGEIATVFPVGVAMASTWNPDVVREVAGAIAREARALDNAVVLAPTINIVRTPLWGRNFETYSEDPFLAAALGVAYVEGLQNEGVGASLKHYAANNQEQGRMTVSVRADERTLREIYLAAFETVVKAVNPWTVMASYNRIDGVYATEHDRLLNRILKGEWGYDGVVVSDWGAVHATAEAANGGTDLEMPGPPRWFGEKLLAAARAGEVPLDRIEDAARRMIRLIARCGGLDRAERATGGEIRSKAHREIATRAAEEALVLLKNAEGLLPLDPAALKRIAVVGPNADARRIQGGGSSAVRAGRQVSLLQAVGDFLGGEAEVLHADGGENEPLPPTARAASFSADAGRGAAGLTCHYYAARGFTNAPFRVAMERQIGKLLSHALEAQSGERIGALRWTGWLWPKRDGRHEISLRGPGSMRLELDGETIIDDATPATPDPMDIGGEPIARRTVALDLVADRGYPVTIDYVRPADQSHPWEFFGVGLRQPRGSVEEAAALAASCDAAIVVIGGASITEGEGYDRDSLDLPGDQNALVEAVLAANPRTVVVLVGGAPYVLPWIDHAPAVAIAWLGGEEGPDAVARILFGEVSPSGRLPVTFPRRLEDTPAHGWYPGDAEVVYGEGLFVGYRHYDRAPEPPLFPFGHGLTYSSFTYRDLDAPETALAGAAIEVAFTLKNVGQRAARETAQLYVRPRGPPVPRPVKELKGFAKVDLAPGESRRVVLALDARAFSFWDPDRGAWHVEPGAYDLLIGPSAADVELQTTVRLEPPNP